MRLKNYTDIPDDEIRRLVAFVKPPGISKFDIRVSNCSRGWRAAAYVEGSGYHSTPDPFIVVSITPKNNYFPKISDPGHGGYIRSIFLTRRECLLHLLAHELRHLWQTKHKGRRGKVWGARGVYSDRDADAYAIRKVREYRRTIGEFKERQALITARGFFNSL